MQTYKKLGLCILILGAIGVFYKNTGLSELSILKSKPGYFKQMPNYDNLVNLCVKDTIQSAISVGKWSDKWEQEIRESCRKILSAYLVAKTIENKYPDAFASALLEVD